MLLNHFQETLYCPTIYFMNAVFFLNQVNKNSKWVFQNFDEHQTADCLACGNYHNFE